MARTDLAEVVTAADSMVLPGNASAVFFAGVRNRRRTATTGTTTAWESPPALHSSKCFLRSPCSSR